MKRSDIAGMLTAALTVIVASSLAPTMPFPAYWQPIAVAIVCGLNWILWKRESIPPMSIREVVKTVGWSVLILGCMLIVDLIIKTSVGLAIDIILLGAFAFFGIPMLVRSVFKRYECSRT